MKDSEASPAFQDPMPPLTLKRPLQLSQPGSAYYSVHFPKAFSILNGGKSELFFEVFLFFPFCFVTLLTNILLQNSCEIAAYDCVLLRNTTYI